jgi:integrase
MASIGYEGANRERKRLIYRDAAGRQKTLRLGVCSERAAQSALSGFERVLEADRMGSSIHPDGVRWLESIDDRLHARVARLGLCEPRKAAQCVTLGELLERFDGALTVKASTRAAYKQSIESLRAHFGDARDIHTIAPADADGWRKAVVDAGYAGPTVSKRTIIAKNIFGKAVRWGMIPSSPFSDLRAGSQCNADRSHYVSVEITRAILAACPDDEWRGIVAMSRFAGLRCPSEVAALRWGDVNWERGRLTVRSPKTSGHQGHEVRVVPIAPALRPVLQALFDNAEPGDEGVIPRLQGRAGASKNLRTNFMRIIAKAGETPWPRLFHNLRASCATDWAEAFPSHVVAKWLGHSPLIAAKHYLQTRDAHFDLAAGIEGGEEAAKKAASNPATYARPERVMRAQSPHGQKDREAKNRHISSELVGFGAACDSVTESGETGKKQGMGATGLEPVTSAM